MQKAMKSDHRMFSASDDSTMMKQIQATHAPDGRELDVRPILLVIEDILRRATPSIDGVLHGTREHVDTVEDSASLADFDGIIEALAYIIHKISCEISCKCSGGGDAHATTMVLFNTLTSYTWDAKVVLSLAAFAVNYGEFWLIAQLSTTNPLAKSMAFLKQLPDIIEHSNSLKLQFDALNKLIKTMMDLTRCIVEFKELPSQYISHDTSAMSIAIAHIPAAAYWIIRSIVACSSQLASLIGFRHEYAASTAEAWELSSLAHKVSNIHEHLKKQLTLCHQHIDEKRHLEYYQNLVHLFETPHLENMKILKALLNPKEDLHPLVIGSTKTRANIEVLRKKHVLLLISDLDISHEEVFFLDSMYKESLKTPDIQYEVVWLPIVDRLTPSNEEYQHKFEHLQSTMPWYIVHDPWTIEPAVIKYIKEVWHFAKKSILVALDPQGKVASRNALHMVRIWGNQAFPFTSEKEDNLWKLENWKVELLINGIDVEIPDWIAKGRIVCLYGGEDIEWIRKFTATAKEVAQVAGINLEMVYVGKNNAKERLRKNIATINAEQLSHYWPDISSVLFFWARLESMLYSKLQKKVENDYIMQEVMTMLSFDGSDQGWAILFRGSNEMARAKGDLALTSLLEFNEWKDDASLNGFVPALKDYLQKLHTPLHCNRLILPGINGDIPERVVCADCGRPMEKYFMYRCCID
ncbi:protein SIEVE ELEMENT OCCLUSION B-like [Fagus crenata]